MIKFENTEVVGWEAAIRGMRNPMNSWDNSDSGYCQRDLLRDCTTCVHLDTGYPACYSKFDVGPNDHDLMMRLRNAGTDHRKFMRMITVYVDITAPLYWWKEFDTYKVGTVANSCSTMHNFHDKEFTPENFSTERLSLHSLVVLEVILITLNQYRNEYLKTLKQLKNDMERDEMLRLQKLKKDYWWQMIQLLPSSYNQKRTVMLNYEVLANIYESRKNHKLDEWSVGFIEWIESLPYSELICGPEFLRQKFNVPVKEREK